MFWEIIGLAGISVAVSVFIFYYIEEMDNNDDVERQLTMEEVMTVLNDY